MKLSSQQQAATAIDDNLVVTAGAGSGKTTVLIARYVRLLQEGNLLPRQIVAITFTKKAAREMRERIDEELAKLSATGQGKWQQYREQLISAPISTIHAFYAGILRQFPLEAGIEPDFDVLDENEAAVLLAAAAEKLSQWTDPRCSQWAQLNAVIGGELLGQLVKTYTLLRNRGILLTDVAPSALYQELGCWQQYRDNFCTLVHEEYRDKLKEWSQHSPELATFTEVAGWLADLKSPQSLTARADQLATLAAFSGGRGKMQREFAAQAGNLLRSLLSSGLGPVACRQFIQLLKMLEENYRELKRHRNGLDYADLQFAVWSLLTQHHQVRTKLRQRYKTYMVDEFQDTDRIQYRILCKLVEEKGAIPPGKLFVVGDEKQSIYRFRGADVKMFSQLKSELTRDKPERQKKITCNYRSQQPLIELTNVLFTQLLAGGSISYDVLDAYRAGTGPRAEFLDCAVAEGEGKAEAEARLLAGRIKKMVEGQEKLVSEGDGIRPVRYGDIAVLLRSRTNLREYEYQLRAAGIPYTVVGGIGFYQQQEIVDMVNLLRVVNNLRDQVALAAALRSPMFAIDDDSLVKLAAACRQHGGTLLDQGERLSGQQYRRLQWARDIIFALRAVKGRLALPELLEQAIARTRYREIVLAKHGGLQCYANIEKLVEDVRRFSVYHNNLATLLTWLDQITLGDEPQAQVSNEEADAVRIMTVHASKGLEFPVVILPICSSQLQVMRDPVIVDEQGGLVLGKVWQCQVWEHSSQQQAKLEEEEFKRLLYVAVTRARDWLTILGQNQGKQGVSLNCWLQSFANQHRSLILLKNTPAASGPASIDFPRPLSCPSSRVYGAIESVFPGLKTVGKGRRPFRYFNISQFLLWQQDRKEFVRRYMTRWLTSELPRQSENNYPGGARFGSLLHKALEEMTSDCDVEQLLGDLLPRYFPGIGGTKYQQIFDSARELLVNCRNQPLPPGQFTKGEKELEFYWRLDDVLFYGVIDKVLLGPEMAVIDFKTNRISHQLEPLVQAYTPQLQFYALAAGMIYKRPVRAYLQFLRLPSGQQLVEIPVHEGDLDQLRQQLAAFVAWCN